MVRCVIYTNTINQPEVATAICLIDQPGGLYLIS
jgi:hypothetical protein